MANYRHWRGPSGSLTPLVAYKGGTERISALHIDDRLIIEVYANTSITLPLLAGTLGINVDINWGDGSPVQNYNTNSPTYDYSTAGTYTIYVSGSCGIFGVGGLGNAPHESWRNGVRSIVSWGNLGYTSLMGLFRFAQGAQFSVPNYIPSEITELSYMFYAATLSSSSDITGWNTGDVIGMLGMFRNSSFNQDISNWNVGNVETMQEMFQDNATFNQPIAAWNTAKVTNMNRMFRNTSAFNRDLSGWCVPLIPTAPIGFDTGATSWTLPKPVWGTCP